MRNGWQLAAYYMVFIAGVACVPAGSKTTDDQVDDGSSGNDTDTGGGGTDTEVTVEECFPGNLSREVSECLTEAYNDGYLGADGWDSDWFDAAYSECDVNEVRAFGEAFAEGLREQASCWDACADGDECANAYRDQATCGSSFYGCYATAMELYECDYSSDAFSAALAQCNNEISACSEASTYSTYNCQL